MKSIAASGIVPGVLFFCLVVVSGLLDNRTVALGQARQQSPAALQESVPAPKPTPAIVITSPRENEIFMAGTPISFAVSVPAPLAGVAKVEFHVGPVKLQEDPAAPFAFLWRDAPPGTHTLTALATDSNGVKLFSAPVVITVVPALQRVVLRDSLHMQTRGIRTGGQFVAGGGWQVTGVEDMIMYDLGTYVENGVLEVEVRNFNPRMQNAYSRHHFLSMFHNPWGNHHPVENLEAVWDLHTGFNYAPGVKLLSWAFDNREINTIMREEWDPGRTYRLTLVWNGPELRYYRDGVLKATHTHQASLSLRHLFMGRDRTVSGDYVTNFKHNQYPAMTGPIFANLQVSQLLPVTDQPPPFVEEVQVTGIYANAVRLAWSTAAPALCYVEYGRSSVAERRTPVLGPPANAAETVLDNLLPATTYRYRVVALDAAGNSLPSSEHTIATAGGGAYLFRPVADTFVERAGLYGTTREHANFGWMHLLMSPGRECYLRFQVAGVSGAVEHAVLRLHSRQDANGSAVVRAVASAWNEQEVTWLTKPMLAAQTWGTLARVDSTRWYEAVLTTQVRGDSTPELALMGNTPELTSFDARESLNHQPELLVFTDWQLPVALHQVHEITLTAQRMGANPHVDGPRVTATFTGISGAASGKILRVHGFWDGGNLYRVRFAPVATGEWQWVTASEDSGLHGKSGLLRCAGTLPPAHISHHGHVRESPAHPYTFAHDDGTPFFLMGDTQWAFSLSDVARLEEFEPYVEARAAQGFNYVHGVLYQTFPHGVARNEGGDAFVANDVDRLNPGFWQEFDRRLAYMNARGLVAGLMLAWGDNAWLLYQTTEQVERFVQYVVDRYAAYNVFWITAGEYEEAAPPGGHAFVGELIRARDPYRHPVTTHTIDTSADDFGPAAWHTTIYQQLEDPARITADRRFLKPVINSEFGYEGDQTADEVRRDAWEIVMRGGFFVYGDTMTYHYDAVMTPQTLNSAGARYMSLLRNFWASSIPGLRWWQFTRFDTLGQSRFLAGLPGAEYVVYAEPAGPFTLRLRDTSAPFEGQWYDTRSGTWGTPFSGATLDSLVLVPPGAGCVAWIRAQRDTIPPVISRVAVSNVATDRATISWQTSEAARGQVEYGLNSSYGTRTPLPSAATLMHAVTLTGLSADKLYHYRILARDLAGNLATGAALTFRTARPDPVNVARKARATASSENATHGQTAAKAVDGIVDGHPGNHEHEWATRGERAGAWLQLDFPRAVLIDRVVLYDRPNLVDQVLAAELEFSNGTVVTTGALPNSGSALRVTFPARTVRSLRFMVTEAAGDNVGLAEIEVWGYELTEGSGDTEDHGSDQTADDALPATFALTPAFPNPFNHETRLRLHMPEAGWVQAVVFNTQGQEVRRLHEGHAPAGSVTLAWQGDRANGEAAGSGMYLLRVTCLPASGKPEVVTRSLLLIK